jgi:hypothetical protein
MKFVHSVSFFDSPCKSLLWFTQFFAPDLSTDHWFLMAYIPCVVFVLRLQVCGNSGIVATLQFVLGQRRQDEEGHRLGRRLTTKTESSVAHTSSRSQLVVGSSVIWLFRAILRRCCTNLHSYLQTLPNIKVIFKIFFIVNHFLNTINLFQKFSLQFVYHYDLKFTTVLTYTNIYISFTCLFVVCEFSFIISNLEPCVHELISVKL